MMPWSGLLAIGRIEHAYEMGTSESHRTSIILAARALTTDRSMHPGRSHRKAAGTAGRLENLGSFEPPFRGRHPAPKIT